MPRPHRARGVALAALLTLARASRVAADVAVRDFAQTGTSWTFQGVAAPAKSSEASDAHALRVTPARANAAGSAFATSKQLVGGGFVAEFAFAITTPANVEVPCEGVDYAPATCARRGGDGLAFLIQNADGRALGGGGGQIGYGGIVNCVAVEFDTFHDAHSRDPYHNHVAVMTRGAKAPALATHDAAIGTSVTVPNLSDGERHVVRVVYDPDFVPEDASHKSFRGGAYLLDLMRDYKHGLGTMKVFIDDLADPVLTVPINLAAFMDLDNGRAWVGFTAATGRSMQNHDVQSFSFRERVGGGFVPGVAVA